MANHIRNIPILGFVAYSGTGKTTLLKKIIAALHQQKIRVAVIKHSHHNFEIDTPGKDSYELRHSGATQTLIASQKRWALVTETPACEKDPELLNLVSQLDLNNLDLIVVEGFKWAKISKIELHRSDMKNALLYPHDSDIIAVATDKPLNDCNIKNLDINCADNIVSYVKTFIRDHHLREHYDGNSI
ncbi:molybdopterin-guanine dinucleotide biosynthesis protein MobB [Kaarinaea lacus]